MKRDNTEKKALDKRRQMLMNAVTMLHIWGYLGDVHASKIRKRISKDCLGIPRKDGAK